MKIRVDDLSSPEVRALVEEHLASMRSASPPESCHALGLEELLKPGVTFWTAWNDKEELLGCGALKELDRKHGEVKSMRTAKAHLREGVATRLLQQIIDEARHRGYHRLSLETGSMEEFAPARSLYSKFDFEACAPFGSYVEDPYSVYMTLRLT